MVRFCIVLLAAGLLAAPAATGEEEPAERLERAELALKSHQLVRGERLLREILADEMQAVTLARAIRLEVEVLVRLGRAKEATELLGRLEARENLPEGIPAEIARMREVLVCLERARDARIRACRARLEAVEASREADRAETRARLLRDGATEDRIAKQEKGIEDRYAPYVEALTAELEDLESGKPPAPREGGAGPGRHGPPRPGEIIDMRRRAASIRARAEKTVSELVGRIDETVARYEAEARSAGQREDAARLRMIQEIERFLREAIVDRLASLDPERMAAARQAYRAALEEMRGRGPRSGRGRERMDGRMERIDERLERLEKSNEEIRALLEKLAGER